MTRTLAVGMVTAATAATGEYCYLLSFAFSGGTLYLTTASSDIDWNSNTYQALGGIGFEAVRETREFSDQSLRVTLDGVDQTVVNKVLQQNYIGKTATLHLAHFTDGAIIADPVQLWSGYMNAAWQIRETGGSSRITTSILSPFVIFRQTRGIRANVASHSSVYPGDTFWRHLQAIAGKGAAAAWGTAPAPWSVRPTEREDDTDDFDDGGGEN